MNYWNRDDFVGDLHYESRHVADARHETRDHRPTELRPVKSRGLVYDRAYAFSFDDGPYEERDSCYRYYDCFCGEEMTTGS